MVLRRSWLHKEHSLDTSFYRYQMVNTCTPYSSLPSSYYMCSTVMGSKLNLPTCVSKVSHIHLLIVLVRHWWAGLCSVFILNFIPGWRNIRKQKKRLNYFSALFKKYLTEYHSVFYSTLRNLSGFPEGRPLSSLSFRLSVWKHMNTAL